MLDLTDKISWILEGIIRILQASFRISKHLHDESEQQRERIKAMDKTKLGPDSPHVFVQNPRELVALVIMKDLVLTLHR